MVFRMVKIAKIWRRCARCWSNKGMLTSWSNSKIFWIFWNGIDFLLNPRPQTKVARQLMTSYGVLRFFEKTSEKIFVFVFPYEKPIEICLQGLKSGSFWKWSHPRSCGRWTEFNYYEKILQLSNTTPRKNKKANVGMKQRWYCRSLEMVWI